MLTQTGPNEVTSSDGFMISRVNRFEIIYKAGDRRASMEVEPGEGLALYTESLAEWVDEQGEREPICASDRLEIIDRICAALDFLDTPYVRS